MGIIVQTLNSKTLFMVHALVIELYLYDDVLQGLYRFSSSRYFRTYLFDCDCFLSKCKVIIKFNCLL